MDLVLEQLRFFTKENGDTFAIISFPKRMEKYFAKASAWGKCM